MFLLWATVHVVIAAWPAPASGRALPARAWLVVASASAAVAATLLNPYGIDLWRSLRSVADRRLELVEWNPLVVPSLMGVVYVMLLVVAFAAMAGSGVEVNRPFAVLFACAAFLPHVAVRHTPFFALTAVFVSGRHFPHAFRRWWAGRWSTEVAQGRFRPVLAGLLLAGALFLLILSIARVACIRIDGNEYPVRAVSLLRASGASGSMVLFFEWGGYVLWHLGPRVKISGDTRREMVYPDSVYRANLQLAYGTAQWNSLLRADDASLALVSKKFPTFNLMKLEPDWLLVSDDRISGLFARRDSPDAERLRQLAADRLEGISEPPACFR